MNPKQTIAQVALLLCAQQALASELESQLRQCRAETDGPKRLACYDAVKLPQATWGSPISQAAAPATSPPAGRFGLPAAVPAPVVVQALESQIDGRFLGWRPGDQFRLRNGQIWEIADDSAVAYELNQPKVRIERGRFGGFFLHIEGVKQTPRVRRVQ